VVIVEDAYKAVKQFLSMTHDKKGQKALLEPFIDRYHPRRQYSSPKIKKIITSCDFPEMDQSYRDKFEVIDLLDEIKKYKEIMKRATAHIFKFDVAQFQEDGVLYLTQPLYRTKQTTAFRNYLLSKKIINKELQNDNKVYIKPHPAERLDYDMLFGDVATVLNKAYPSELFEIFDIKFKKAITFGSTGVDALNCADEKEKLLKIEKPTLTEVKQSVNDFINDERLTIDYYFVLESITPKHILDIFTYRMNHDLISQNVILIVSPKHFKDVQNMLHNIKSRSLVRQVIRSLSRVEKLKYKAKYKSMNDIHSIFSTMTIQSTENDDAMSAIMSLVVNSSSEYFMIQKNYDIGFDKGTSIKRVFKNNMPYGFDFEGFTLGADSIDSYIIHKEDTSNINKYTNVLWHRSAMRRLEGN
jgi:ribosomal protein L14E/L6E/L27E